MGTLPTIPRGTFARALLLIATLCIAAVRAAPPAASHALHALRPALRGGSGVRSSPPLPESDHARGREGGADGEAMDMPKGYAAAAPPTRGLLWGLATRAALWFSSSCTSLPTEEGEGASLESAAASGARGEVLALEGVSTGSMLDSSRAGAAETCTTSNISDLEAGLQQLDLAEPDETESDAQQGFSLVHMTCNETLTELKASPEMQQKAIKGQNVICVQAGRRVPCCRAFGPKKVSPNHSFLLRGLAL